MKAQAFCLDPVNLKGQETCKQIYHTLTTVVAICVTLLVQNKNSNEFQNILACFDLLSTPKPHAK